MILTQHPRPASLFRRSDVITFRRSDGLPSAAILTQHPRPSTSSPQRFNVPTCKRSTLLVLSPYRSHPYKCPLPQPLSFDNHTNARGCTPTLPILGIVHKGAAQIGHFFSAFFSSAYTLFQVTYPVTPLLATLTKTAGCIPNNSHSGTRRSNVSTFRRSNGPLSHRLPVPKTCICRTIGANLSLGQTVHGSPFRTFILCGRV